MISLSDWCTFYKMMMSHVPAEACDDDALIAMLQKGVDDAKAKLAAAEQAE